MSAPEWDNSLVLALTVSISGIRLSAPALN